MDQQITVTDTSETADLADPLDDLAAELDDTTAADVAGDDSPAETDADLFTGTCWGGPYAGMTVTSRYPKGFLLVNRPTGTYWAYDLTAPGAFTCTGPPLPIDETVLVAAVDGDELDTLVYDAQPARP